MTAQAVDAGAKPADALSAAREALARGDLFFAYDAATRAIGDGDASEDLKQQQLLALARMGETRRALTLFRSYGLDASADPHKRALGARLLKDRALQTKSAAALRDAYEAYRAIFKQSEDPYPGINAATMALLAGDPEEARWLATNILVHPNVADPQDYYCAATAAEANLILGKPEEAAASIRKALALGGDVGARAGTLRQLTLLSDAVGLAPADRAPLLALLRPPATFHYAGHIFMPAAAAEARIKAEIAAILDDRRASFSYGSAAAGADILVLEAMRARGADTHIVLPCRREDFIEQSVRPAGDAWVGRFEACLAYAVEVSFASEMEFVRDPAIFGYGSAVAMGLARLRAQHLLGEVFQLAVWDGQAGGEVGSGADVRLWRSRGGETLVVDPGAVRRDYPRPAEAAPPPLPRKLVSILMTDYAGFSKLSESALPKFDREVMGRMAGVLARHGDAVLARNTWGDALFTVMKGAAEGAQIAIDLQRALAQVKSSDLGLQPGQGGMRIALHYGSAYQKTDQITGQPNFDGGEVARAARIEPITPPGAVYVTEPMAAMLALEAPDRFRCSYVGRVDLAKKYGSFPMYRLEPARDDALNLSSETDSRSGGEAMANAKSPTLFVSHHSSKLPVAEHVERALNAKGIRCWVAPRDVDPGEPFDKAIRKAIADTDAMLLLFCSRSEKSRHVKRELILADQLGKAIIPLRLERIDPGELSYHLADSQWIDWLEQRDVVIDRIAAKARDFQEQGGYDPSPPVVVPASSSDLLAERPAEAAQKVEIAKPADTAKAPPPVSIGKPPAPAAPPAPAVSPFSAAAPAGASPFGPAPAGAAPFGPPGPQPGAGPYGPPPYGGPAPNPAQPGSKLPVLIVFGILGALLVTALVVMLLSGGGGDPEPAPGPSGESTQVTEEWFAGRWSDNQDCSASVLFDPDGSFATADGTTGTWTIDNGDTLVIEAEGAARQELPFERLDDDRIRSQDGVSYRCN